MQTNIFMERMKFLNWFKSETEEQLLAIQNEDPERFLISVEVCDDIIRQMNSIDGQGSLTFQQESELKSIGSDIIAIRKKISSLLPSLKFNLEQNLLLEKEKKSFNKVTDMRVTTYQVFLSIRKNKVQSIMIRETNKENL